MPRFPCRGFASALYPSTRRRAQPRPSYCANVGQQGEDYDAITKKAKDCGASKVYIEDLCEEFVTDFVFEAVKANAQYEGRYLLGTRREIMQYRTEL